MLKRLLFLAIASAVCGTLSAQTGYYTIHFTDKEHSPYSLESPQAFLSQKALDRRAKQGIALDSLDIPVDPLYISQVLAISQGEVVAISRWFNSMVIRMEKPRLVDELLELDFVAEVNQVRSEPQRLIRKDEPELLKSDIPVKISGNSYGPSWKQIAMHKGHLLHEAGFTGKGMEIGVIDAGFSMVNQLPVFSRLRERGQIISVRDFVDDDSDVYGGSNHGTYVLSTMAGWMVDSLIGTAPEARYWLFRTEDTNSEFPVEEEYWIAAAELADSLGLDILNTSLGYSNFDNPIYDYSYYDMNGETTRISRGAAIAASKGMLVVNSAGNSGANSWHYITAPADADGILSVGAIDSLGNHAFFSSYGPTSDGRVKPNVMALGQATVFAGLSGGISRGNGTSFSSPIMAGLAACLWQAHPSLTSSELLYRIERSSTDFHHPVDSMGFGIPDFWKAHSMLSNWQFSGEEIQVLVYPNPFSDSFYILVKDIPAEELSLRLYASSGQEIPVNLEWMSADTWLVRHAGLGDIRAGLYMLRIETPSSSGTIRLMKQ
jgi:hypothetical protein